MAVFEIDSIFFKTLKNSDALNAVFSGDIFVYKVPEYYEGEFISINTLDISETRPQKGTSNIGIYVPDLLAQVNHKQQHYPNATRIVELSNTVRTVLNNAVIPDFAFEIQTESIFAFNDMHYSNLRINWINCNINH